MTSPVTQLRERAKASFPIRCAVHVIRNAATQSRLALGLNATDSGTQSAGVTIDQAVGYAREVVADYKRYAGIERFHGVAAEVGPGDNAGVALTLVGEGCERVDLADRYWCRRDSDRMRRTHERIVQAFPDLEARARGVDLGREDQLPGIRWRFGPDAAAERFFAGERRYDFILSRAVLEHVNDPLASLHHMACALRPGGVMAHKVDLRDHGMFSDHFHELKFLEVPRPIYRAMTARSGRPNRVMLHEYRRAVGALERELPIEVRWWVSRLVSVGDLEPHAPLGEVPQPAWDGAIDAVRSVRPRLARELRDVALEDLAVSGFFVVMRRR